MELKLTRFRGHLMLLEEALEQRSFLTCRGLCVACGAVRPEPIYTIDLQGGVVGGLRQLEGCRSPSERCLVSWGTLQPHYWRQEWPSKHSATERERMFYETTFTAQGGP
jgi:hypothetical protein